MEYGVFKAVREILDKDMRAAEIAIDRFPRLANGLHSDEDRANPEYKLAKSVLDLAFANMRSFNGKYAKMFQKEIKADIQEKRLKAMGV